MAKVTKSGKSDKMAILVILDKMTILVILTQYEAPGSTRARYYSACTRPGTPSAVHTSCTSPVHADGLARNTPLAGCPRQDPLLLTG